MNCKMFEIRDRGTFIPVLAVQLGSNEEAERWLTAKAGFGGTVLDQEAYILLCQITGGEPMQAHTDPYAWGQNPRTYHVAHVYIRQNWDNLETGAVIDVEFILGERVAPKVSERRA